MKAIRELLRDRRRRQRGSVLSAVLILTAFIAIISGALMTALSTNLLLSRTLVNRVNYQATENSAVELSISNLQSSPLNAPCPSLGTTTLNGVTAAPAYFNCWATVREPNKVLASAGAGAAFQQDGYHAQVNGVNDYVVGDAAGNVFDIPFGWSSPRWSVGLAGQVTAPPLVFAKPGSATQVLDVIPLSGSGCATVPACLNVRIDTAGSTTAPAPGCIAAGSGGTVSSRPALSPTQAGVVYYAQGNVLAATDVTQQGGECDYEATAPLPDNEAIVASPVAFRCSGGCGRTSDEVFVVVGSQLLRYTYGNGQLALASALNLPWANATGLAVSAVTIPASVAITFGGGGVALVQILSSTIMSLAATASIPAALSDAPYWCNCPGGDQIGVGARNGALYVYNSVLQQIASSPVGGAAIDTTPGTDGAGNWYFGARDGVIHEVQIAAGAATQVDAFGPMGQVESGVQVASCPLGICVYAGALDNHVYLVPLDARRAIISACISTAPPACSGANPRLWASLEVGAAGSPQTVHVEGWSYYSG